MPSLGTSHDLQSPRPCLLLRYQNRTAECVDNFLKIFNSQKNLIQKLCPRLAIVFRNYLKLWNDGHLTPNLSGGSRAAGVSLGAPVRCQF